MCLLNVISDAYLYGINKTNVLCVILAVIRKRLSEEKISELSHGPDESDLHVTEEDYVLSHKKLFVGNLR